MSQINRVTWIDVCRGIGIIIVIYTHALGADRYRYFFYSFHMPLFFFLSGLVYNRSKHTKFFLFIRKTVKDTLLPFFIFALVSYILWLLFPRYPLPTDMIVKQFFGTFYANSAFWDTKYGLLSYNNILWFLPCLFVVKILFAAFTHISTKLKFLIPALFLCSLLGYLYAHFFAKLYLPYAAEIALTAVVFYGAGYLWRTHIGLDTIFMRSRRTTLIAVTAYIAVAVLSTYHFITAGNKIDMRLHFLGNYIFFYLTAAIGIVGAVAIGHIWHENKYLTYLGKNSMILFAWHLLIFDYLTRALLLLSVSNKTIQQLHNTLLAPLYTVISMLVILLINVLFSRLKVAYRTSLQ